MNAVLGAYTCSRASRRLRSQVRNRLTAGGSWIRTCMGLSLSSGVFRLLPVLCSEREGPFFIPSPTIRFPERAQWGQGIETLAKLGALRPSGACVWQRLDA